MQSEMTNNLFRKFAAFLAIAALVLVGSMSVTAADSDHKADKPAKESHEADGDHGQEGAAGHDHDPRANATTMEKFAHSYLTAYMFFLSISLGSFFLVLIHHLFDAQWLVPIRRYLETVASLLGLPLLVLWIPVGIFAAFDLIYPWFALSRQYPITDHALYAKRQLFNIPMFYLATALIFAAWWYITSRLRYWSVQQDIADVENGGFEGRVDPIERNILLPISTKLFSHIVEARPSVLCSRLMNIHASYGILAFALTLTFACIFWMKSIQHQWFSTMYGVYYFAGSVWVALGVAYYMQLRLKEKGPLEHVVTKVTTHDTGKLFFAFTVFYAYIHFSQYFLIWNAAIPEETFWYVQREAGSWWWVGQIIIFGHFFIPFLILLPIATKVHPAAKRLIIIWAMLMHYLDMQFNIMPNVYPAGINIFFWDIICVGFIGFAMWVCFNRRYDQFAPYPQRDPRIAETMGVYVKPEGGEQAV